MVQPSLPIASIASSYIIWHVIWQGYLEPGRTVLSQTQQSTISSVRAISIHALSLSRRYLTQQSTVSRPLDRSSICCQSRLPCAQIFRYYAVSSVQASRVAYWQILLNVPLLCSSTLHSHSLSCRRFLVFHAAVLATCWMHALSESPRMK